MANPLEWTTTETPPTPEPVTVRHELHVKVYRAGANELGAAYERLITSRRATPDDLARLGYVPATPPESKQRVDGFIGAGEPDARIAELEASAARAPGLRDESNGEAGDFTTLCDACYQETDEPHSAKDCVAYRNHVSDQDGKLMREQYEERLSALTAEVERLRGELVVMGNNAELFRQSMYAVEEQATKLRGELAAMTAERDHWRSEHSLKCYDADHFEMMRADLSAIRERYAGLERAAREAKRVHWDEANDDVVMSRARIALWDAVRALDSAPAPTDVAQPADARGAKAEWVPAVGDRVQVVAEESVMAGCAGVVTKVFSGNAPPHYDVKFAGVSRGAFLANELELWAERRDGLERTTADESNKSTCSRQKMPQAPHSSKALERTQLAEVPANPPKIPDGSPAPTDAAREAADVRPVVRWFAEQMERKLRANDHKGGWENDSAFALFERLHQEAAELARAIRVIDDDDRFVQPDAARVIAEAADVANMAMMVADHFRDGGPSGDSGRSAAERIAKGRAET